MKNTSRGRHLTIGLFAVQSSKYKVFSYDSRELPHFFIYDHEWGERQSYGVRSGTKLISRVVGSGNNEISVFTQETLPGNVTRFLGFYETDWYSSSVSSSSDSSSMVIVSFTSLLVILKNMWKLSSHKKHFVFWPFSWQTLSQLPSCSIIFLRRKLLISIWFCRNPAGFRVLHTPYKNPISLPVTGANWPQWTRKAIYACARRSRLLFLLFKGLLVFIEEDHIEIGIKDIGGS